MTDPNATTPYDQDKDRSFWEKLREIWNRVVQTKIKHVVSTLTLFAILVIAVQIQIGKISGEKTAEITLRQYDVCVTRVETRTILRDLLLGVYDDVVFVLPASIEANQFHDLGYTRVNINYPELDRLFECGESPRS